MTVAQADAIRLGGVSKISAITKSEDADSKVIEWHILDTVYAGPSLPSAGANWNSRMRPQLETSTKDVVVCTVTFVDGKIDSISY